MIKETVTYTSRKHEEKQETAFIVAIKISPFLSSVALPDGELRDSPTSFFLSLLVLLSLNRFPVQGIATSPRHGEGSGNRRYAIVNVCCM